MTLRSNLNWQYKDVVFYRLILRQNYLLILTSAGTGVALINKLIFTVGSYDNLDLSKVQNTLFLIKKNCIQICILCVTGMML